MVFLEQHLDRVRSSLVFRIPALQLRSLVSLMVSFTIVSFYCFVTDLMLMLTSEPKLDASSAIRVYTKFNL
jgi:hypothetical protein